MLAASSPAGTASTLTIAASKPPFLRGGRQPPVAQRQVHADGQHQHREADFPEFRDRDVGRVHRAQHRRPDEDPREDLADDDRDEPARRDAQQRPAEAGEHDQHQRPEAHRRITLSQRAVDAWRPAVRRIGGLPQKKRGIHRSRERRERRSVGVCRHTCNWRRRRARASRRSRSSAGSPQQPIRVLLADDHPGMLASLRWLLDRELDVDVVGEECDLHSLTDDVLEQHPDVLVLDLSLPGGSSLETIGRLREQAPQTEVVVLTMQDNPAIAQRALSVGASGYVTQGPRRHRAARRRSARLCAASSTSAHRWPRGWRSCTAP